MKTAFIVGVARLIAGAAAAMVLAGNSSAQPYPSKAVRVVVASSPGGGLDMLSRIVGHGLDEALGQTFVIDNRPGAGGTIGVAIAARSAPDGYTLLIVPNNIAISPSLYRNLPYDTLKDLIPVTILTYIPSALLVRPSIPVTSFRGLLSFAKSNPGQLNYASGGNGTSSHLGMDMLREVTGMTLVHVPYKGIGPAINDLIAGRVSLMISGLPPVLGHLKSGRLRALAIVDAKRTELMPDLPTVAEMGFPSYAVDNWIGLFAPAGTRAEVIRRLHGELTRILAGLRSQLAVQGYEPVANTPEQFAAILRSDIGKWAQVVKANGIHVD